MANKQNWKELFSEFLDESVNAVKEPKTESQKKMAEANSNALKKYKEDREKKQKERNKLNKQQQRENIVKTAADFVARANPIYSTYKGITNKEALKTVSNANPLVALYNGSKKIANNLSNSEHFEDGYDFGDITKTTIDYGKNIAKFDKAKDHIQNSYEDVSSKILKGDVVGAGKSAIESYAKGTKIGLNTGADAAVNFTKGILNTGENIGDKMVYGIADVIDKTGIGRDYIDPNDLRKEAQKGIYNEAFEPSQKILDKNSLLTDSSRQIVESSGNMYATGQVGKFMGDLYGGSKLATEIGTYGTIYENASGSAYTQALNEGATPDQARAYSIMSGAAEVGSEKMFDGVGFFTKADGGVDSQLVKKATSGIKNKKTRNLIEAILLSQGEGVEEVASGVASAYAKKLTYRQDATMDELLKDENLVESYLSGAASSGISQVGNVKNANKTGRDLVTTYTKLDEDTIKNETTKRIEEAEKDGNKLSKKEKAEIKSQVEEDYKKGEVSIGSIRKAYNEEKYNEYKTSMDEYNSLNKSYQENLKEIQSLDPIKDADRREKLIQINQELKQRMNNSNAYNLKNELDKEINANNSNSLYLGNNFENYEQRNVKYQYDDTNMSEEEKAIHQSIQDSGAMNTKAVHRLADAFVKFGKRLDTGKTLQSVNNEQMKQIEIDKAVKEDLAKYEKEKGYKLEGTELQDYLDNTRTEETNRIEKEYADMKDKGVSKNGFVTDGNNVYINMQSLSNKYQTLIHEVLHTKENAKSYKEYTDKLKEFAEKYDVNGKKLETIKNEIIENYKLDLNNENDKATLDSELATRLSEEYLGNEEFVKEISKNKNTFTKILDTIKGLIKDFTGTQYEKELRKIEKIYEKVLNEESLIDESTNKGLQNAIKRDDIIKNYDEKTLLNFKNSENDIVLEDINEIDKYVDDAYNKIGLNRTLHYGVLKEDIIEKIRNNISNMPKDGWKFDLKNYELAIKEDAFIHFTDNKTKLTKNDVKNFGKKIPDIVANFDSVEYSKNDKNQGLRFKKTFEDGTYISFTLTSDKKNRLLIKSISMDKESYANKKRSISPKANEISLAKTSKTNGASASYESNLSQNNQNVNSIQNSIKENNGESLAYHYGDLGKGRDTNYFSMTSSNRSTGHFGTGTYFVGNESSVSNRFKDGRPQNTVDFNDYNLLKIDNNIDGWRLHDALKAINNSDFGNDDIKTLKDTLKYYPYNISNEQFDNALFKTMDYKLKTDNTNFNEQLKSDSPSTIFIKELGFNGIDTREASQLDNSSYGSVIYDLNDKKIKNTQYSIKNNQQQNELKTTGNLTTKENYAPIRQNNIDLENNAINENDLEDYRKQTDREIEELAPIRKQQELSQEDINEIFGETPGYSEVAERDYDNLSDRSVKSYQYEHPEVKKFFQPEARDMLNDLKNSVKGERTYTDEAGWMVTTRETTHDIADLLDEGYTYNEIEKGLNAIIQDHGAENIAISKKIEVALDNRLMNGYTDMNGYNIPANQEYIDFQQQRLAQKEYDTDIAPIREKIGEKVQQDYITAKEPKIAVKTPNKATINENMQQDVIKDENYPTLGERKWHQTALQSDLVYGEITEEDLDLLKRTYEVKSNKKTLEKANNKLDMMGYEKSVEYFKKQLSNPKISTEDIALGQRLIQESLQRGDKATTIDLIQDVSIIGTELGQQLQILSLIQKMTPTGQVKMLQKIVDRGKIINEKVFNNVEFSNEMKQKILDTYNEDGITYDQEKLNKTIEDIKQDLANQMDVRFMEKANEWRYLSMLGNPKTHIRNMVSNVAMKMTEEVKNAQARTLEDVFLRNSNERTKTWKRASEDVKQFAKDTTLEMKDLISGSKYNEQQDLLKRRKIFKSFLTDKVLHLNQLTEFNSNMLEKEDWWFSKASFKNNFQEYLTANGIKTQQDILENPEIIEKGKQYALEQAQISTFRQYSKFAAGLNNLSKSNKVAGLVIEATVPFKKTPINVAKTGVEYSAIGLGKTLSYDLVQLKKGNITASQFINNLTKGTTGTGLMTLGYVLASMGFVTGAGDDDKEAKYDSQLGSQSYSIVIGGKSYSIDWLNPVAIPFLVGAQAYEVQEKDMELTPDVMWETLANTLDPMQEMSFMSSFNDIMKTYSYGGIQGVAEDIGQNYLMQYIPTISSQTAATLDDTKRSTAVGKDTKWKFGEETYRKAAYKIPGLRNTLEPTIDIWGNEVKQDGNIAVRTINNFIAPYKEKGRTTTAIDDELLDIYANTGNKKALPTSSPDKVVQYNGEEYKMTAKQYTDYKKTLGNQSYQTLEELFKTESYKNASDDEKSKMIGKVFDYAKEKAKSQLLEDKDVPYTENTSNTKIKGSIDNDMTIEEYNYYQQNPNKYKTITQIDSYDKYNTYKTDISNIKTKYQGTKNTTTRKNAVIDYVNSLNISQPQKIMLLKEAGGYSIKEYNNYIVDYLNNSNLSYDDKMTIYNELFG